MEQGPPPAGNTVDRGPWGHLTPPGSMNTLALDPFLRVSPLVDVRSNDEHLLTIASTLRVIHFPQPP